MEGVCNDNQGWSPTRCSRRRRWRCHTQWGLSIFRDSSHDYTTYEECILVKIWLATKNGIEATNVETIDVRLSWWERCWWMRVFRKATMRKGKIFGFVYFNSKLQFRSLIWSNGKHFIFKKDKTLWRILWFVKDIFSSSLAFVATKRTKSDRGKQKGLCMKSF